jgi:hypothetical protein
MPYRVTEDIEVHLSDVESKDEFLFWSASSDMGYIGVPRTIKAASAFWRDIIDAVPAEKYPIDMWCCRKDRCSPKMIIRSDIQEDVMRLVSSVSSQLLGASTETLNWTIPFGKYKDTPLYLVPLKYLTDTFLKTDESFLNGVVKDMLSKFLPVFTVTAKNGRFGCKDNIVSSIVGIPDFALYEKYGAIRVYSHSKTYESEY